MLHVLTDPSFETIMLDEVHESQPYIGSEIPRTIVQ
jgi:hypothetical protein